MNIRIEDTNGKKKYWVNDVSYDRIEDIPVEYQKHFIDKNSDGMPDHFDELLGMKGGLLKDILKSTKEEVMGTSVKDVTDSRSSPKSSSNKTSTAIDDYSSAVEERSIMPTVIKIGVVIFVVLIGFWLYPQFVKSEPGEVVINEGDLAPVAEETLDLSRKIRLTMDDPNEPPYHVLGVVYAGDTKLFSFELPGGAISESSDSTMQIAMTRQEGTNLNEATFSVMIRDGVCTMREDEFNTDEVQIGDLTFKKAELEDSDEGHSDHTYRYSLEKYGRCFHFRMALHSANPSTYDPPVEVFDEKAMISTMEAVLGSIKGL
jgi:hypothetical protein